MFTKKILGIHLNDISMVQEENANIEESLIKIESHLSSIARTRNEHLKNKERGMIVAGAIIFAFIIIEVLAVLGVIG